MKLFKSGDHVVCGENVYGGTYRLFDKILRNFGMCFTFLDTRDPQRIEDAITPKTVAVLLETPTNPLMRLTDLAAAGEIAKRRGVMMIVDNTFATPVFQRPIEHGASIVFHSTTKYLNGHSDMIGGICVLNDDNLAARIQFIANAAGAVPGPMDSWLALRGTKTLALRMRQHDSNGRRIAEALAKRLGADRVHYPGSSPPAARARQAADERFGGMISVETDRRTTRPSPRSGEGVFARRVARWRGIADQPSGVHDACFG